MIAKQFDHVGFAEDRVSEIAAVSRAIVQHSVNMHVVWTMIERVRAVRIPPCSQAHDGSNWRVSPPCVVSQRETR